MEDENQGSEAEADVQRDEIQTKDGLGARSLNRCQDLGRWEDTVLGYSNQSKQERNPEKWRLQSFI